MSGGIPVSRAFAKNMDRHAQRRFQLCADQRQPHGIQQAGQSGCGRRPCKRRSTRSMRCRSRRSSCCIPATSAISRSRRSSITLTRFSKAPARRVFFVPGEHDVLDDNGKSYLERYGKGTPRERLVQLRQERRAFHRPGERDEPQGRRTWRPGRGTAGMAGGGLEASRSTARRSSCLRTFRSGRSIRSGDGARTTARRRLGYLKTFGSVTVLNGHIHQTMQKVEGNVTFHTAMSTAFPQPQPAKRLRPAR